MSKKTLILLLIVVDIPIIIGVLVWFFMLRGPEYSFDNLEGVTLTEQEKYEIALPLGHSERMMWEAYYTGDTMILAKELVSMLRVQFGVGPIDAAFIGESLAKAAKTFAGSKSDYEENVLPHLVTAYTRINEVSGLNFNPREAAAAELNWWTVRRTPGKDSIENVGKAIANLYVIIYGADMGEFQVAGRLRAVAADKRDKNKENPPWDEIEANLTEGYIALITGLTKKPVTAS